MKASRLARNYRIGRGVSFKEFLKELDKQEIKLTPPEQAE